MKIKQYTLRINNNHWIRLRSAAKYLGVPASYIIRCGIEQELQTIESERKANGKDC